MPFWKRDKDPHAAARRAFNELRGEAQKAVLPADRARLLNLAGDVALGMDDEAGALAVLGEALDVFLHDRDYHSARAVARKLLRVRAQTVRVRSTLAWLALAQEFAGDARVALDLYVNSLNAEGQREHAIKHLTAMAGATRDRDVRSAIAEHLTALGAPAAGDEVRRRLEQEEAGEVAPSTDAEIRARWQEALDHLVSPAR